MRLIEAKLSERANSVNLVNFDYRRQTAFMTILLLLLAMSICLAGCQLEGSDDDGFGRIRGNSGYGTIDGISGFVHLLKSRGLDVNQSSRISPLIERYETIIWAPDRWYPPSGNAIERLQQWVNDGQSYRRLIFIGPGFRSRQLLDKKQVELATGEGKERAVRRLTEKLIQFDYRRLHDSVDSESCEWYELKKIKNQPIIEVTGKWSEDIPVDQLEIYTGDYDFKIPADLKPNRSASNQRAEVLLAGDGHNLVYRIPPKAPNHYDNSFNNYSTEDIGDDSTGIFIICNGSFFQNYGLANPVNQQLAKRVAGQCAGKVLVLQSGPQPITVTESLAPEENGWAWLQKRPLRDIVPFFLLLATFTFFAVFPIHGRPKRIRLRPEKTFADHIRATGLLLKSSKDLDGDEWAKKTIKKYHDGSSDKK